MTDQTPSTALALPEPVMLAKIFAEPQQVDDLLSQIEATVRSHVPDLTTAKGRKAIASLAHTVARSKTALDGAGKDLTDNARKQIAVVDAERRKIRERMDTLKTEVRQPLDDWEAAEEARIARHKSALLVFGLDRTTALSPSAEIREVLAEVEQTTTGEEWDEYQPIAEAQRAQALTKLRADLAAAERSEAEREELARLRAAEEDRQRREAEERAAREAAEAERLAAEEAERRAKEEAEAAAKRLAERAANARAYINQIGLGLIGGKPQPFGILIYELESKLPSLIDDLGEHAADLQKLRIATHATVKEKMERQRAEEEAAAEAQRKEAAEAAAKEAEERAAARHQRELDAAAQAERDRIAAERKAAEDAAAKRAADQAHRDRIKAEIAEALSTMAGAATPAAIAEALIEGRIPHVKVML
ncbi:hypothetical protein ACFSDD_11205 [Salipiger marinus]|uniref:hypothetical protein n=1 Tax=Salipiger marinus TaxID=555512 RepID=UPI002C2D9481|nr:hypothetical protein [Salipiger manganoxidans]MEB3419939.1 hypothetical protein [Salipiger manganoxidans]